MDTTHNSHHERLAGVGDRLVAFLLDFLLPVGVGAILYPLGWLIGEEYLRIILGGVVLAFIIWQFALIIRRSASLGKFILNLQVVNSQTGQRIGFWRYSLLREFIGKTLVIGAIPLVGLFFQPLYALIDSLFIFRRDRRTLHDLIANTVVVKLPEHQKRKSLFDWTDLPK